MPIYYRSIVDVKQGHSSLNLLESTKAFFKNNIDDVSLTIYNNWYKEMVVKYPQLIYKDITEPNLPRIKEKLDKDTIKDRINPPT